MNIVLRKFCDFPKVPLTISRNDTTGRGGGIPRDIGRKDYCRRVKWCGALNCYGPQCDATFEIGRGGIAAPEIAAWIVVVYTEIKTGLGLYDR